MTMLVYTLGVLGLCVILTVFAYLDRIFRELGRVTTGRLHENLDAFESAVEARFRLDRRRAALGFAVLTDLFLVVVAIETARGVLLFAPSLGEAAPQLAVYLLAEVLLCVQFVPYLLVARTTGRWLLPMVPAIRVALAVIWPLRAVLELAISVAHLSDEERSSHGEEQQEGIEALVEAAQEEGILAHEEAQLIEQVVEFSDKRVLELMTPRPDVVAIPATATIDQLRRLLVETRYSRVPVYQRSLDDILGIASARELLQIPESEAKRRAVRELVRPVLFVPETKLGSELLREMQQRNQEMAVAVDEHGLVAGVVTVEDLVEEIVGEMGRDESHPVPDVVREPDGGMVLRGSVSVERVQELFGVEFTEPASDAATTVAGLLNSVAGHVPRRGEQIEYEGLHFEVVEANQRKVLRLRVRRRATAVPAS